MSALLPSSSKCTLCHKTFLAQENITNGTGEKLRHISCVSHENLPSILKNSFFKTLMDPGAPGNIRLQKLNTKETAIALGDEYERRLDDNSMSEKDNDFLYTFETALNAFQCENGLPPGALTNGVCSEQFFNAFGLPPGALTNHHESPVIKILIPPPPTSKSTGRSQSEYCGYPLKTIAELKEEIFAAQ